MARREWSRKIGRPSHRPLLESGRFSFHNTPRISLNRCEGLTGRSGTINYFMFISLAYWFTTPSTIFNSDSANPLVDVPSPRRRGAVPAAAAIDSMALPSCYPRDLGRATERTMPCYAATTRCSQDPRQRRPIATTPRPHGTTRLESGREKQWVSENQSNWAILMPHPYIHRISRVIQILPDRAFIRLR